MKPIKRTWQFVLTVAFAGVVLSGAGGHTQATPNAEEQLPPLIRSIKGPDLFRAYCASCHGLDAKGAGPVAPSLKATVPDLTLLEMNNREQFPAARVHQIIMGDEVVAAHGSREMPIWGPIFHQVEGDMDWGNVRLENLVKYLESIQSTRGSKAPSGAELHNNNSGVLIAVLLALLLAGAEGTQVLGDSHPQVVLRDGVLEGNQFGPSTKYAAFLGIPYAVPPVGDLRWRPPQPPASWQGVRPANRYGPACPQLPSPWLPEMLGRKQMLTDEACLYLNVWTENLGGPTKLPVMVWVHGGGNVEGSQEWPPLGPTLAVHGVVVVTINYRVGILGFLSHPALTAESPHRASGNYGLLDQMAALRWVQQNIDRFGGDPQRVTVFGASSGALDICDLMASPLANGLFQRAIMQSGVCVDSLAPLLAGAEASGVRIAADIGLGKGLGSLAKLRAIPADELVRKAADEKDVDFNPVVDGWVFHQQPALTFSQGDQARVPVIVGSNIDEVSIFASPLVGGTSYRPKSVDEYRQWLSREFHSHADAVFAAYPARTNAQVPAAFCAMDTDYQFGFGARLLAHEMAAAGKRAYLYMFTNVGAGQFAALGAFHSEESMFLSKKYWTSWVNSPGDARLSSTIIDYWVKFAKAGRPSAPGLPPWPAYRPGEPVAQEFGSHVGQMPIPRAAKSDVFEEILKSQLQPVKMQ